MKLTAGQLARFDRDGSGFFPGLLLPHEIRIHGAACHPRRVRPVAPWPLECRPRDFVHDEPVAPSCKDDLPASALQAPIAIGPAIS